MKNDEPPVGTTVQSASGHRWYHHSEIYWLGCLSCDADKNVAWTWPEILDDTRDDQPLLVVDADESS